MRQLNWCQQHQQPILKVPLIFSFPPVETLMKELTRLNSPHPYRISYLGPRWADSVTFHKKYSAGGRYFFDDRRLAKNSFFHESMTSQFYKNEIFYRAFQGMNPTLNLKEELIFESRFQGGNLDCVVKVSDDEYDLFLRIDSNTRGNIYWFYFAIRNCVKGKRVRLNICNLTKGGTHYQKGLNPFSSSSTHQEWTQDRAINVSFKEKRLRYRFLYDRLPLRKFYQLSFEIDLKGEEEIRFAYCIPYTYSDLTADLKLISTIAEVAVLGQSLSGVNIPLVMIGKDSQSIQKQVLLITGRVHPGQSNSSIILSGLMRFLCFSQEARYMRQKIITIIVPMINPDGVILGNSRCGVSGKDLNREFQSKSKFMFPQVVQLKNLVDKISETHDIELYLDFHGHSRKKNVFMFGPDYNLTQPDYYKCRVFPKLLSSITNIFRYYSCQYGISNDKKSTARAVMLNQMLIPIVFTVESSLGFYHDYSLHKNLAFTRKKWEEIGESIGRALKEYCEGIEQYEQFIAEKKKAKQQLANQIRQATINLIPESITPGKKLSNRDTPSSKKEVRQTRQVKDTKDINIFQLFEEIRQLEQQRPRQEKREKGGDSGDDSDSHNSDEEFQKQKMKQFSTMVTDFVEEQEIRRNRLSIQEAVTTLARRPVNLIKRKKEELKKRRQNNMKEQQDIFADSLGEELRFKMKRNQAKTEKRRRSLRKDIELPKNTKIEKDEESIDKEEQQQASEEQKMRNQQVHDQEEEVDFLALEKRSNKMNIRMFNFSKLVQNSHLRANQSSDPQENTFIKSLTTPKRQDFIKSPQIQYPLSKPSYLYSTVFEQEQKERYYKSKESSITQKIPAQDLKNPKTKMGFPPSFYRIKYHSNQRKKQQIKKSRYFYELEESSPVNAISVHRQQPLSLGRHFGQKGEEHEIFLDGEEEKKLRLYQQLRRFSRH